jgi:tetratricopeptide (TPR) repeat protein
MMMKNNIALVLSFLLTGIISGQSSFDALLKAKSLLESGKSSEAIEVLSSAIGQKQESRLYVERAEAYMQNGDYSGAFDDYNKANSLTNHSGDYGLARIYALKGETASSLQYLEWSMSSPYRKSEKEILLDPVFSQIENSPDWRKFWKRDWYSSLETGISEIEYYVSKGKKEEAADILSELEGSYKGNEEVVYAKALLALSSGKPVEAVRFLTSILASEPSNEKYLRLLAKAQTEASNPAGASLTYSKLLEMEIPDADLLLLRAGSYRKTGEMTKAMSDIERYLSLYPHDKSALSLAGKFKSAMGDNLKAIEYFSENLKYHPGDPDCYNDRANIYLSIKSWDWAINDYSMSLDLDPSNSEVWLNKGIARLNSGRIEDACLDFNQSLRLGNKNATDYISRYCIK